MRERMAASVRALASPVAVFSLVLLVLNDHVLKQAWPGPVTGKLSDLTGLVVAPLLLAVGLAPTRLPLRAEWACAVTAGGFVVVKLDAGAAAAASDVWSLTGFPTTILADPTDLVAVPAVLIALSLHRRAARTPHERTGRRPTVATATGFALLPVAVLATAATSCLPHDGATDVWVASGEWALSPGITEQRLVMTDETGGAATIDAVGTIRRLDREDDRRLRGPAAPARSECDRSQECWRLPSRFGSTSIEHSTDGGDTWSVEYRMPDAVKRSALEDVEPGCGDSPNANLVSVAVLADGPRVLVAASHAGVLMRSPDGEWTLMTLDQIPHRDPEPEDHPTPAGTLTVVRGPRPPDPTPPPGPGEPVSTGPPCPSPTYETITPNPSNGPPTTVAICP